MYGTHYGYDECADFSDLVGKVIKKVERSDNRIVFWTECGLRYTMEHSQSCCESVYIESIAGDLQNLVGKAIFSCSEETNNDDSAGEYGIGMWTFYKITAFGEYIDIRWYGSSNGYYSVGVSFYVRDMNKEVQ